MLTDTAGDFYGFIFNRLVEEQHEILGLADAFAEGPDNPALLATLARAVRLHDRAEEVVLFPILDGSYELGHHVREDVREHRVIESLLEELQRRDPTEPGFRRQINELRAALEHNFVDEQDVYARARTVVSDEHAQELLGVYEQEREYLSDKV
jgi:hemerythrin superfamily protein